MKIDITTASDLKNHLGPLPQSAGLKVMVNGTVIKEAVFADGVLSLKAPGLMDKIMPKAKKAKKAPKKK